MVLWRADFVSHQGLLGPDVSADALTPNQTKPECTFRAQEVKMADAISLP